MFSMPNTPPKECLFLCHGKDCKKKQSAAYRALLNQSEAALEHVGSVGCQGSCVGPTAVVATKNGPVWFEDLRSSKSRNDLVEYAVQISAGKKAKPTKRLAKRELTGKRKKEAKRKFAKHTA